MSGQAEFNISLLAPYSSKYPSIGETHALSVLAGVAESRLIGLHSSIKILDMVSIGNESIDPVFRFVSDTNPHILGISAGYGTFEFLVSVLKNIRKVTSKDCWIVIGGPLATYIPELLSPFVDNKTFFVRGEGEIPWGNILTAKILKKSESEIPGFHSVNSGGYIQIDRKLSDLSKIPKPYRHHATKLKDSGAQIFCETSRGCSWSNCSFCLRGLTDLKGTGVEYRSFSESRILQDIKSLIKNGVESITFADEDFIGKNLNRFNFIVSFLEKLKKHGNITFDISALPDSIYQGSMSIDEIESRRELMRKLKELGLRKVFLGIESGSHSQLKRFNKSHNKSDAVTSLKLLQKYEIDFEIGWIMFDPLCTVEELLENSIYLKNNNIVGYTSNFFNELRLQCNTKLYRQITKKWPELIKDSNRIRPDTLSYSYSYKNLDVQNIVKVVKKWSKDIRPIHYPLKNFSRFGDNGLLGVSASKIRSILYGFRTELLEHFISLIEEFGNGNFYAHDFLQDKFNITVNKYAINSYEVLINLEPSIQSHPGIRDFIKFVENRHLKQ